MSTVDDSLDISSEISSQDEFVAEEVPLLVFRVMGSTVVTLLVGFTIIIYVTSGMFHVDCLAQICCESCIFAAYMLILLTTTESFRIDVSMCLSIAVFLHFLFISAAIFLLLEAMCMCQTRLSCLRLLQFSVRNVLVAGWICPAVITGLSAILWFNKYTTKTNCWLNMNQYPYWPSMIPMVICACVHVILILLTFIIQGAPISLTETEYKRHKCYRTTRWASLIISLVLNMCWFFGVTAYHTGKENYYGAFTVSSILLGVCIFILRISTDDEMREKITENVLCCLVQKNKVTNIASKSVQLKKNYTESILDSFNNGKLMERQNGIAASHK